MIFNPSSILTHVKPTINSIFKTHTHTHSHIYREGDFIFYHLRSTEAEPIKPDTSSDESVNERSKVSGISHGFIKRFLRARGCWIKGQPACCRSRLKGRTILSSTVILSLECDPLLL